MTLGHLLYFDVLPPSTKTLAWARLFYDNVLGYRSNDMPRNIYNVHTIYIDDRMDYRNRSSDKSIPDHISCRCEDWSATGHEITSPLSYTIVHVGGDVFATDK